MIPTPKDEFDPIIPGGNDFLAVSQGDFLSNFGQLYNAFVKNHIALDSSTSSGNHTNVQLLQQDQGPQTNVGELSLYCKEVDYSNKRTDNLFLRYQGGNPAGKEVQMTTYQLYNQQIIQPNAQFGLFSYLPGGLILYFGVIIFSGTPGGNTLLLSPFICTNVMAFNFCTSGTTPQFPPDGNFLTKENNIITTFQARATSLAPSTAYFYIILGNTT